MCAICVLNDYTINITFKLHAMADYFFSDISDNYLILLLLFAILIGFSAGFLTGKIPNKKYKKQVLQLENEMLRCHKKILNLQTELNNKTEQN